MARRQIKQNCPKKIYEQLIKAEQEEAFCAEIKGKVVGFCTLSIKNSLWQEGHICELIVDETFRGKSVGTNLIKIVSNVAEKRGCKKVV